MRRERTSWLLAESLADGSLLLEVDVPALGLTSLVLQGESKDSVGSLEGALAGGIIGLEGLVDGIESLGGWERSYDGSQWLALKCYCPIFIVANARHDALSRRLQGAAQTHTVLEGHGGYQYKVLINR